MKKYLRPKPAEHRFSLHDANVLGFVRDNKDLVLETDYGFADLTAGTMVDGSIRIVEVCFRDSCVMLMRYTDVLCGNIGHFTGEKMALETFIEAFGSRFLNFNVKGEYEGFRTYCLTGFVFEGDDVYDANVEIAFDGEIVYEVGEGRTARI